MCAFPVTYARNYPPNRKPSSSSPQHKQSRPPTLGASKCTHIALSGPPKLTFKPFRRTTFASAPCSHHLVTSHWSGSYDDLRRDNFETSCVAISPPNFWRHLLLRSRQYTISLLQLPRILGSTFRAPSRRSFHANLFFVLQLLLLQLRILPPTR